MNNIMQIIKKGESETVEFKLHFDEKSIETLTAFANKEGGAVYIGINDHGSIKGVTVNQESIQSWINEIKQKTSPRIIPEVDTLHIGDKVVITLSITEYPVKPVAFKGRYYRRVNNSNHLLDINEVVNSRLQSLGTSWDSYESNKHTVNDISLEKVNNFIKIANTNRNIKIVDDPLTVLKKYDLIKEDKISRGCYLLFMEKESNISTVEMGRFQADTIIKDSARSKNDLFSQVHDVLNFIYKHINKEYIITGKARRDERWDYPLDAIREIVINMIVHRDYSDTSDSIVKIFNNKIEFYNPGCLLGGLTIEKLLSGKFASKIRNKQIADIFKEAGLIEKYGSGIARIIESFKSYKLIVPEFTEVTDGFMVKVYKDQPPLKYPHKTPLNTPLKIDYIELTDLEKKVFSELKKDHNITFQKMAEKLDIGYYTVREYVERLKNKWLIKRVGARRGGYWEILNKK